MLAARCCALLLLALSLHRAAGCSGDGEGTGGTDGGTGTDGGGGNSGEGSQTGGQSGEGGQTGSGEGGNKGEIDVDKTLKSKGVDPSSVEEYDSSAFRDSADAIEAGAELDCDFGSPCCWANDVNGQDEFTWKLAGFDGGSGYTKTFKQDVGEPFLLAYGSGAKDKFQSARFVSCTVKCTDESVRVKLNYFMTEGVVIDVCVQDTFTPDRDRNPLVHCVQLPPSAIPGPITAILPPGNLFDIVISARNFVGDSKLGMAGIDNIQVKIGGCDSSEEQRESGESGEGTTRRPSTDGGETSEESTEKPDGGGNEDNCRLIECTADEGKCEWLDAFESPEAELNPVATMQVDVAKGRYQNPLTGVLSSSDGGDTDPYLAAYMTDSDFAALETRPLNIQEDVVLRFKSYEATYQLYAQVCIDGPDNCPFKTNELVTVTDRSGWKSNSVLVPKGTKKIIILMSNTGTNEGAFAIDQLQLLRPAGADPNVAEEPLCK